MPDKETYLFGSDVVGLALVVGFYTYFVYAASQPSVSKGDQTLISLSAILTVAIAGLFVANISRGKSFGGTGTLNETYAGTINGIGITIALLGTAWFIYQAVYASGAGNITTLSFSAAGTIILAAIFIFHVFVKAT